MIFEKGKGSGIAWNYALYEITAKQKVVKKKSCETLKWSGNLRHALGVWNETSM